MKLRKPRTKKPAASADASSGQDGPKVVEKPKKKHKLRYILLYLAVIGFVFYAVITIINQNVKMQICLLKK